MQLPDYDWNDFTARFEAALKEADEREGDLSKEAEALSTVRRPGYWLLEPRGTERPN